MITLENKINAVIRDVSDFPKPGILFKDITPIFRDAELCNQITDRLAAQLATQKIDAIVGVESRGFLFGFLLANKMNVPFVLIRKKGKLPYQTIAQTYDLEYGNATIEMQVNDIQPGWNIVLHDDVLATGGTAEASALLIKKQNANVAAFAFLIELEFLKGKEKLANYSSNIHSIIKY